MPVRYRATGISIGLDDDAADLRNLVARHTGIDPGSIHHAELSRRSIDARRKNRIRIVLSIDFSMKPGTEPLRVTGIKPLPEKTPEHLPSLTSPPHKSPVVVGMGPAGLFAALVLAEHGAAPIIIDRGAPVEERARDVSAFWGGGPLDQESNVQFGEGGAGTFSDGKLTTRIDDVRVKRVLETLVEHGAPENILYDARPHVGTDVLKRVVVSIRKSLEGLGARIRFRTRLGGISVASGAVRSVTLDSERLEADVVVLAPGNAARDTFNMLAGSGVEIRPKSFAVGARIEHPREFIDRSQYGSFAGHPRLGAADYALTFRDRRTGRSAYTFCMCPGGYVVNASSETAGVVVNGMSYSDRAGNASNSAIVVTVGPGDFPPGPLGGMELQRSIETAAIRLGEGRTAPAQGVQAFMEDKPGGDLSLATLRPVPAPSKLSGCLPDYVYDTMKGALGEFDRRIRGFIHPEAVLTGVETRTSSPLRITRDTQMQSVTVRGLFPCGEGSGYAGGIVSSAVDGIKAAEAAIRVMAGFEEG